MRIRLFCVALSLLWVSSGAQGQDPRDLSVRTFRLRNLRPDDAAKLIGPYVNAPNGGVFEAGNIGAITVRETNSILALVDSLLQIHDKARAIVTMKFQLIAALDTARRDPAIADIDAELRKLFRFAGYELIGEGTARTDEMSEFTMSLSTRLKQVGPDRFREGFQIRGFMEGVDGIGDQRTVRMTIALQDASRGKDAPDMLRTGLTMSTGQSVILGSASPTLTIPSRVALILVVQPEVMDSPRR